MAKVLEQPQLEQVRAALADRYEIERLIGEGGTATVYRAHDLRHGRKVAIKLLRPELAASIGADRFLREIRLAARLQHPHILPLYDSGQAGGVLYYVMPLVEGESLRARLAREPQLPLREALRITREVADALAYAHAQGVVHRDIKPENILLHNGHALVADFGVALAADIGGEKLTRSGISVGTPHYMSPEQAAGEPALDGRSDVYSLGCVLYEMLAGDPPFQGRSATTILARHSLERVPGLRVVREAIPAVVEDVALHALEKSAADRMTAAELAEALMEMEAAIPTRRTPTDELGNGSRPSSPALRRTPSGSFGRARRARSARIWAAVLAVCFAFVLGWSVRQLALRQRAAAARLDPTHIAVLYFDRRGGPDSLGYLADGVTEELIHSLSGVPTLQVISRNGVRPYRNANVAPDSIANALKVGTLVQGTLEQRDDRLRLTVWMVDGATGREIADKTIERPSQQILALQGDLAQEVSIFLRKRLGAEVKLLQSRTGTREPRAWHRLQQAQELTDDVDTLLAAGDTTGAADRLRRADSLLALAERLDPAWNRPTVARGWLAFRRLDLIGNFDKAYYENWTRSGLAQAERALRRHSEDPDALELRGALRYYRWVVNLAPDSASASALIADAEADLESAVAGNPTAAFGLSLLSHLLMSQSRTTEAKLAALRAYQADPYLSSAKMTIWRLFQTSLDLEDAAESARWCDEGARRFPRYYRFAECRLWLFALKDQTPDIARVWRLYREYLALSPPPARAFHEHYGQMIAAMALARAGLGDSARAVVLRARADTLLDQTRDLAMLEAMVRTMLGDRDEAFRQLSLYLAANPQMRAGMSRDQTWWFRDLRADPRYQLLLATPTASR
ncbi:MAG TPA: serine/threonine-protein kinase [Gemmatimonadales bacterium]|nr:serine/threonine-protein kinase [Gemmatimonadales bacterium]